MKSGWFWILGLSLACGEEDAFSVEAWRTRMSGIEPKGYEAVKATGKIEVDGALDEEAWKAAAWTDDFVDIEGAAKPAPRWRTRVKMLWDEEYFYVAAEMEEPQVWGTLTKHDSVIFQDPDFEIFLDPNGDTHEYGEFEMNALGTTWDLFLPKPYKDQGKPEDAWEIEGLKRGVKVDGTLNVAGDRDRGWTLEVAMPWKSLKRISLDGKAPAEGAVWRVNFSRVEWEVDVVEGRVVKRPKTPECNWVWSPQGVIDMHRPEMWGKVRFVTRAGTAPAIAKESAEKRRLFELYYAQRSYRGKQGQWASQLGQLGLTEGRPRLQMKATEEGYEAWIEDQAAGSKARWSVRQDAKLDHLTGE